MTPDDNTTEGLWNNKTTDLTCYSEHLCGVKCDNYDYTQGTAWLARNVSILNYSDTFFEDLFAGNAEVCGINGFGHIIITVLERVDIIVGNI